MDELIRKLNQNNNFHLSLKSIQITDENIILELYDKLNSIGKSCVIINKNDTFKQLQDAFDKKVEYLLIDENIDYMIPLVTVITKDEIDIVKPTIPVYYLLKDNKIIQKLKTKCNKTMTSCQSFKTKSELIENLIRILRNINTYE